MNKTKTNTLFVAQAIPSQVIADCIASHSSKTAIGAHSIFLGQVRTDQVDGKTVQAIEYSVNDALAHIKMGEIRNAIFEKYALTCMHVYHSVGTVQAGGICLFVFTSAAHRKAALAACEEVVERIKNELPVWGKEIFENNSYQWKTNK